MSLVLIYLQTSKQVNIMQITMQLTNLPSKTHDCLTRDIRRVWISASIKTFFCHIKIRTSVIVVHRYKQTRKTSQLEEKLNKYM